MECIEKFHIALELGRKAATLAGLARAEDPGTKRSEVRRLKPCPRKAPACSGNQPLQIYLLTTKVQDDRLSKVNEYSLWYKKELPASHLIDAHRC